MADVNINVQLKVIGDGVKAVEKSTKQLVELEKAAQSVGGSFKRIGEVALGAFGGNVLSNAFTGAASAALSFAKSLTSDAVAAASAQEDAVNRLNVSLAASGQFTKQASQGFQDFASQLQATTKFEDDAIINTGALITSITGLSGKALQDATLATANLATALGKDLDSAATVVSKALEGNVDGLKKFGIEVKKGATEAETISNVLATLNNRFGNAATGAVSTFSGSLTLLKNSFGDLQEEIGFVITQNPVVISLFKVASQFIQGLTEVVKENAVAFKEGLGQAIVFIIQLFQGLAATISPIVAIIQTSLQAIVEGAQNIKGTFQAIGQSLTGDFAGAFDTIKNRVTNTFSDIKEAATGDNFVDKLGIQIASFGNASQDAFEKLKSGASTSVDPINAVVQKTKELTAAQIALAEQGVALANAARTNAATDAAFAAEQQRLVLEQGLITQQEFFIKQQEIRAEQYNQELVALQTALEQEKITREQFAAGQTVAAQKLQQDLAKIEVAKTKAASEQEKQRAANFKDSLGTISSLQSSSSKELFAIGQAAAIAQATIDGIAAVQKALTAAPPPFNFALAALVGVATAANIGKIASAQPPKLQGGLTQVPAGFNNDTFPAFLNSGERVISGPQNEDLKEFLTGERGNAGMLAEISSKLSQLQNNVVVNVGGKEIINVINDQIDSGRVLSVA